MLRVVQLQAAVDFAPSQSVEPSRNVLVAGPGCALPASVCAGLFQARLMLVQTPPHPSQRGERCRILCRGPCDAPRPFAALRASGDSHAVYYEPFLVSFLNFRLFGSQLAEHTTSCLKWEQPHHKPRMERHVQEDSAGRWLAQGRTNPGVGLLLQCSLPRRRRDLLSGGAHPGQPKCKTIRRRPGWQPKAGA